MKQLFNKKNILICKQKNGKLNLRQEIKIFWNRFKKFHKINLKIKKK